MISMNNEMLRSKSIHTQKTKEQTYKEKIIHKNRGKKKLSATKTI